MKTFLLATTVLLHSTGVFAFSTDQLELGCGYSDNVYPHILATMQEKAKLNTSVSGKQGEDFRRILIYGDASYAITVEFLSRKEVEKDITCIVAKGEGSQAYDAVTTLRIEVLPAAEIGGALLAEDRALLESRFVSKLSL